MNDEFKPAMNRPYGGFISLEEKMMKPWESRKHRNINIMPQKISPTDFWEYIYLMYVKDYSTYYHSETPIVVCRCWRWGFIVLITLPIIWVYMVIAYYKYRYRWGNIKGTH